MQCSTGSTVGSKVIQAESVESIALHPLHSFLYASGSCYSRGISQTAQRATSNTTPGDVVMFGALSGGGGAVDSGPGRPEKIWIQHLSDDFPDVPSPRFLCRRASLFALLNEYRVSSYIVPDDYVPVSLRTPNQCIKSVFPS